MHTGCADGADFFLVGKQAAAGVFGRFVNAEDRIDGSICANAVIMAVTYDHAAVKTTVTSLASWNDLKLCREEIFLFYTVFLIQKFPAAGKHPFLFLKQFPVMVPDNIIRNGFLHISGNAVQMEKALIAASYSTE